MAESGFDANARHMDADGVSSYGLMQLRIDTARKMLDAPNLTSDMLLNPKLNILAGTRYIQLSLSKWPNIKDAIAAYNAGIPRKDATGRYVNSKGMPNVQTYVDRVYNYYSTYKQKGAPYEPVGLTSVQKTGIGVGVLAIVAGMVLLMEIR